jgi:type IV fimbrial biogenesis protein FimT
VLVQRQFERGVSLIELVIGLAILGILLVAAAPSFTTWVQNTKIRATTESIHAGLQMARAEAVRRNQPVRFALESEMADWSICLWDSALAGCSTAEAAIEVRKAAEVSGNVRVGAEKVQTALSTSLAPGAGVPGGVTFSGLGRVASPAGVDLARIDVRNAQLSAVDERRLVVTVSPGGGIKWCDPSSALQSDDPRRC